ncbi:MAG: energy transducer TonB [Thermodesulfovibrionales bacterium]|nr:energy transducer TonB [Thermodesulfovibrionales bacterium]
MAIGNILLSVILHAAIIAVAFSFNVRDTTNHIPADHIVVSLLKEMTGITSVNSQGTKRDEDKISGVIVKSETLLPVIARGPEQSEGTPKQSQQSRADSTVSRNEIASPLARNDTPTQHSFLNPISDNSKSDITGSAGKHGGISGEIIFSQNTGFPNVDTKPKDGGSSSLLEAIRTSIERAKSYPFLARKKGIEGTVLVSFKIDRKGSPKDIKIIKSSGYQILDDEVPKMLRKASPFPEVKGEIVIPITFKLTESMPD